jgi:hypothetical protein
VPAWALALVPAAVVVAVVVPASASLVEAEAVVAAAVAAVQAWALVWDPLSANTQARRRSARR